MSNDHTKINSAFHTIPKSQWPDRLAELIQQQEDPGRYCVGHRPGERGRLFIIDVVSGIQIQSRIVTIEYAELTFEDGKFVEGPPDMDDSFTSYTTDGDALFLDLDDEAVERYF